MTIPTNSLDETKPAGSRAASLGDNDIREYKTQNREILEVDHTYPSSGQDANAGTHKKCSFIEQADLGTGAVGKTLLGSQTVSGKGELVYTDEDDNDIQITSGGKIYAPNLAGVYPAANVAALASIMNFIYPVGSVVTLGVSTNPGTLFGVGTWTAIEGRVIVGKASSGTFGTLNGTGGAETHTLTTNEMPAHAHTVNSKAQVGGGSTDFLSETETGAASPQTAPTSTVGGGAAHNNLQPYIVKYVWERTA